MMKSRDLNLSKKLEGHLLFLLECGFCCSHCIWTVYIKEQGKYQNICLPGPNVCGSLRLCCGNNDSWNGCCMYTEFWAKPKH
ncbi:unnamed protein product [Gulo gulo]|uniref:Uncharacterized protein n=1 Tax=Gulo gulo TaxID=48420 RepID=A0A9X9LCD0_GULGU|nr:unnamed protein product [Gulo gulo]